MQLEYFNRPKDSDEEQKFLKFWNTCPLAKAFGFTMTIEENGTPVFTVTQIEDWHQGGGGSSAINGGIIAALCDYAVGMVGILNLPDGKKVTADLCIDFKKPLEGANFRVIGGLDRLGSNMVVGTANVYDQSNNLCAQAKGRILSVVI